MTRRDDGVAGGRVAERVLGPVDEARAVLDALAQQRACAVVVRLDGELTGARLLIGDDGLPRGSLGDPDLDERARAAALDALRADAHEAEAIVVGTPAGDARILVQVHRPPPELFIVGAGHISLPLARMARMAGFRVTVLDDREDFADAARFGDDVRVLRMDPASPFSLARPDARAWVVLVTRAHRFDYDCLRELLRAEPLPRYVGMIGSRRRVRAAFTALLREGVARERLARVRAPLGLDIGAETPEEIAVSVVAEMIAVRRAAVERDDAGAPLSAREGVLDRFFPEGT